MRIEWDKVGERLYETGVDRGVIYPQEADGTYPNGAAWNGLTEVSEKPSGAEPTPLYANNKKYLELLSAEDFAGSIGAYMYPDEFGECNGMKEVAPGVFVTQQSRKPFGFTYRNFIGNDTEKTKHGYKLHVVYGATTRPSEKTNSTVNKDPEASTMSWEFTTTPVECEGIDPTAHLIIDSTKTTAEKMKAIEDILYGTNDEDARLPLISEIINILKADTEPADPTE